MQIYNVEQDRKEWARVKVSLMSPQDRKLLMAELIAKDERGASDVLSELVAAQHGARVSARRRVAYP